MANKEKEFINKITNEVIKELYSKQTLTEGLIMTHDIKKVSNILKRYTYNKFDVFVDYDNWIISLEPTTEDKEISGIIKFLNNMGYFVSSFIKNNKYLGSNYTTDYDTVIFEAKYDKEFKTNGIVLYHVTERVNVPKILKIGFVPKSKNKLITHPERIYFAKTPNAAIEIYEIFKDGNYLKDPVVLKIDTNGLDNKFMLDRQFEGGIYTTDNIPPQNIITKK